MATLDISKMLSRTFDTMGENLGMFLPLSLLLTGIPAAMLNWWWAQFIVSEDPDAILTVLQSSEFWPPAILIMVIGWVTHAILQGALAVATIRALSGEPIAFATALDVGLERAPALFAISLIINLGTGLGLVLLIVPGVILWLCWCVAIPVYANERPGIAAAFARSLALTSGNRGKLFLLMLVVLLIGAVIGFVGGLLSGGSVVIEAIVQAGVASVSWMLTITATAVTYVALVELKEGSTHNELEAVFD